MVGLASVRRRQRSLTRAVLALFLAAWLQAALAPCAMAHGQQAGAGGPAPAGHAAHGAPGHDAGHHGGDAPHHGDVQAHPCIYCLPGTDHGASADCDGRDCAYPHEPQVDGRAAGLLFAALPVAFFAPAPAASVVADCSESSVAEAVPRNRLSISYCRFNE